MHGKSTDRTPTAAEFAAVDAVFAAYMAMNAADGQLAISWRDQPGPMGLLADAGRLAWRTLGFTPSAARILWWLMCDGGSTAEWVHGVWKREGPEPFRFRAY